VPPDLSALHRIFEFPVVRGSATSTGSVLTIATIGLTAAGPRGLILPSS
jgi:hypothetical protein